MHRNRTWTLDPPEWRTQRNRVLAIEGGDGSTLSLDFTTGVLDSRLTFSRGSNATFVNSQGYIQYSNTNMLRNSDLAGTSGVSVTNWSSSGNASTIPNTGARTFTVTTSNTSFIVDGGISLSQGLVYTAVVEVSNVTGNPTMINTITATGTPTNEKWYQNGVLVTNNTIVTAGTITYVFTAGSSSIVRIGLGCTGSPVTNQTITITSPRVVPGTNIGAQYFAGTISAGYYGPRFDYDPTALTPRGLLIEGAATNLFCWSESFATSGGSTNWGYNSNTGAVVSTTNPAGGSTAFQFAETANSGPLQQSVTVTNAVHTFSAWFKASTYSGTTTTQVQFGLYTTAFVVGTASIVSGPGSASVAGNIVTLSSLSTTQWTRVQLTTSAALPAGSAAILIYPNTTGSETNASFHIWGAQLEAGSGVSSYIPTGASQGNRAQDLCYIDGANFLSWFGPSSASAGTLYASWNGYAASSGRFATINDNSYTNQIWLGQSESAIYIASSGFVVTFGGVSTNGGKVAMAYALGSGNTARSLNGASVTTATASQLPTSLTRMDIGNSQAGTANVNCWLRAVKYWPYALTNSQLQSLTS